MSLLIAEARAADSPPASAKPKKPTTRASVVGILQTGLEPKAVDILKAASERLAAARSMSFTAVISYENPSAAGPPLVFTTTNQVTLQRPDKLRVVTPGDGPASEFLYDGKNMVAYAPAEQLVATAPAPAAIDAR
jgi:hypothetical protein